MQCMGGLRNAWVLDRVTRRVLPMQLKVFCMLFFKCNESWEVVEIVFWLLDLFLYLITRPPPTSSIELQTEYMVKSYSLILS